MNDRTDRTGWVTLFLVGGAFILALAACGATVWIFIEQIRHAPLLVPMWVSVFAMAVNIGLHRITLREQHKHEQETNR